MPSSRGGRATPATVVGATSVVFAAGLSASMTRSVAAFTRTDAVPVTLPLDGSGSDPSAALAVVVAQPGTAHATAVSEARVTVPGVTPQVRFTGYDGDGTWTGHQLVSGRWYRGPHEVVASSRLLRTTGLAVGDSVTLAGRDGERRARIVGELFENANGGLSLVGDASTLTGLAPGTRPGRIDIGLRPGTDPRTYADSLTRRLADADADADTGTDTGAGTGAGAGEAHVRSADQVSVRVLLGLVATLTAGLAAVAALGVLNTVVLNTRDRIHEIGVLKAIGMTPGQVRAMVVASMTGIGLVAGAIALPAGYALHHAVLPVMAGAVDSGVPAGIIDVYTPIELAGLGASGVTVAVVGALLPAGWAARTRVAVALRTE